MTMICLFILSLFASVVSGANYVFMGTNAVVQSSPRPLPVQGVSLTSGNVVVGLPSRSRIEIADCGWYEYKATPAPATHSNEYYRVVSIARDGLYAIPVYKAFFKAIKAVEYSKRLLYREFVEMGKWGVLEAFMRENGIYEDFLFSTTLESDDIFMRQALEALPSVLGMTKEQLDEVLKKCVAR